MYNILLSMISALVIWGLVYFTNEYQPDYNTIIIVAISFLIFYFNNFINKRMMQKQIYQISSELRTINKGNFFKSLKQGKASLLNELVIEVNNLLHNVKMLIADTSTGVEKNAVYANDFYESSEILAQEVNKIVEGSNESFNSVSKGFDVAQITLSKMEELASEIDIIDADIERVSSLSETLSSNIKSDKIEIENIINLARITSEKEKESAVNMKKMVEETKRITNIIDKVSSIAEQTNLLALNANIEAARAGEYGKGFSVVAEEVRKLAEESTKIVNNIKNDVLNTVATIEETVKTSEEVSDDINTMLENILKTSKNIELLFDSVYDINGRMKNVSNILQSQGVSIREVASVTEELTSTISVTSNVSQNNLDITNEMKDKLNNLKQKSDKLKETSKLIDDKLQSLIEQGKELDEKTIEEIELAKKELIKLSRNDELKLMNGEKLEKILKEYMKTNIGKFGLLFVLDSQGKQVTQDIWFNLEDTAKYENALGSDYSDRKFFSEPITNKKVFVSEPRLSYQTYNFVLNISVPIYDGVGQPIGVLVSSKRLD